MGSTRLPGKVLKQINGKPLIEILLHRLSLTKRIDKIILATSNNSMNNGLVEIAKRLGYEVYLGSEDDVLDRYYKAAKKYEPKSIVRITGDCPLIDPQLVDNLIGFYHEKKMDYVGNGDPPTFPDGLDIEVFSYKALETAYKQAKDKFEREHVTPFIRNNKKLKRANFEYTEDLSSERWTVDESEDLQVINEIINHFSPRLDFTWQDVYALKKSNPELFKANKYITRNEGAKMGTGQKLWKRAKKIIPGANMLLSKRAEMFLPDHWPSYYRKAKGCEVWDLDGNKFIDMSIMGIGTCSLGYANTEVNAAVKKPCGTFH